HAHRVGGSVVLHRDREGVPGGAGGAGEGRVGNRDGERDRTGDVDRVGAGRVDRLARGGGGRGVGHRRGGDVRGHRVGHGDRLGGAVGEVERAVHGLQRRGGAGLGRRGLGDPRHV